MVPDGPDRAARLEEARRRVLEARRPLAARGIAIPEVGINPEPADEIDPEIKMLMAMGAAALTAEAVIELIRNS